ncbi:MAG: UDP-N-acetylmuramoyl-L-alanyl-D-glutamate--2,6-diaminopimelate ligase, partial [Desulfobacterales bacterium]|nr:UDP-N-acetylmuramoyl-L-alanyl-D-glutamate--2,6-diaminopimelate ligase [Desulfobacterales bacterium]
MTLGRLIDSLAVKHLAGFEDHLINSVHYDSRAVRPGGLFVAVKGLKSDGYAYIDEAVERGAVAVVAEKMWQGAPSVCMVQVEGDRRALAAVSAAFYMQPSREPSVIGITGTNGKTTTAYLVEAILNAAGFNVGVIGTVNYRFGGQAFPSPVTTPESLDLMRILRRMADSGVSHVILEVSSHALDLDRVASCEFDVGVFTNLSRDHLDYHESMETYWQCKKKLCVDYLGPGPKKTHAAAVINWDDPRGKELAEEVSVKCLRVGLSQDCRVRAEDIHVSPEGASGRVQAPEGHFDFNSRLLGRHNVY